MNVLDAHFGHKKHYQSRLIVILTIVGMLVFPMPVNAQVQQTSCSEIWDFTITVSDNNGNYKTLVIGQGIFATGGLDDCDEQAPPPPPAGAFDARISSGLTDYFKEYRVADQPGGITWLVKYQASTSGDPITLSWDINELPGAGTWILRDNITGTIVNVNMRIQNTLVVPFSGITQLEIVYTTTRCTVTAISSGNWDSLSTWDTNCTGIPVSTDDVYIPADLAISFNNAPATVESLTIGTGGSLAFSNSNQLLISDNAFVRGGTLDLGTLGNLAVSGSLTNLGVMQQTKVVNELLANAPAATESYLDIGGYGGLTLTANATGMGSTTVQIKGGQLCDTDNSAIWRCFTVIPSTSVTDAGVVFYFGGNELNTSTCAAIEAWRSTGGSSWISAGGLGTRSCAVEPYSVSYSGVSINNTGSTFNLRNISAPTAITLITFSATKTTTHSNGILLVPFAILLIFLSVILQRLLKQIP